jgi:propanol-preferring alcohol dehydrogenase
MRAAVVREFGSPLKIEEVPIPTPGPGEVLVRIVASGVCHTDIHAAEGDWPVKPKLPFIPGHEGVGYVAELGSGVKGLKVGDVVGIAWLHDACGECEHCITGWETLCASQHNTGYNVDGCYAEYAIASAAYVARLPGDCDLLRTAPILCAGVTTYKGIKETEAKPGEWIAISGIGGLGHVAVQYAKAMGMQVVALDVGDAQLRLARSFGADLVFNAVDEDAAVRIIKQTGGGVHGALVTAVSPKAFEQSLSILRPKGTVSFVGLPSGNFPTPIFDVVLKRLTLRGSIVGTRKDLQEAIAFATQGKVTAHIQTARLEDINPVFADLKAGKVTGRVVLDLSGPDL